MSNPDPLKERTPFNIFISVFGKVVDKHGLPAVVQLPGCAALAWPVSAIDDFNREMSVMLMACICGAETDTTAESLLAAMVAALRGGAPPQQCFNDHCRAYATAVLGIPQDISEQVASAKRKEAGG